MSGVVFYALGFGFLGGIAYASVVDTEMVHVWLMFVMSGALAIVWRQKSGGFLSPLFVTSIIFFTGALGMAHTQYDLSKTSLLDQYVGERVEFLGRVNREPEIRSATVHLYVSPEEHSEGGDMGVLVVVDRFAFDNEITYGDTIRVRGDVTIPQPFETETGRTFNYPLLLRSRDVTVTIPYADVSLVAQGSEHGLRTLYTGKQRFIENLEQSIPMPHAGLGEGILLGVKRALGDDLEDAFRKTGIIHIVVLSGYNVLIVVESLMIMLAYVCGLRARMIIGLASIALFGLLVGPSATVVRACIMASLLVVARGMGRTYTILRALMLACVIMLMVHPLILIYDVGFQLSFLATLGLVLFVPYFEKRATYIPEVFGVRAILSATIATQIMVLPLLLYQMGVFSLVALVVNMLVLPMVPITMLATFVAGVTNMWVPVSLSNIFGVIAYGFLNYIIRIAEWFSSLPFASYTVETFPWWLMFLMYVGIAVWYFLRVHPEVLIHQGDRKKTPSRVEKNDYDGWVIEDISPKNIETKRQAEDDVLPFRR